MKAEGLFEKLSGQFADGTRLRDVPPSGRRVKSIAEHLWRMFNTRQGAVPHLDDYGLPDIGDIYRRLPDSLRELEKSILATTAKYEPRLEKVKVKYLPAGPLEFKLAFELSASLVGGERVSFRTSFASTGETVVKPQAVRTAP